MHEFNFQAAFDRISNYIVKTPLIPVGADLLLKAENRQTTGSFKLRGALNKVLQLGGEARQHGVLSASAGNHGLGVAYACRIAGIRCTVVVPRDAVKEKVEGIRRLGAEVIQVEGGYGAAERLALSMKEGTSRVWISPYNDKEVMAGAGSVGLEILEQADVEVANVFVPVSGGGLACGVGLAIKKLRPAWRVIGVQTAAAPYMAVHLHGGDLESVRERETIADGLAGPIEPGSLTLELIFDAVDDIVTVTEREILSSMAWVYEVRSEEVEPSAAVAVAASRRADRSAPRVAILSGGNVDRSVLARALQKEAGQ